MIPNPYLIEAMLIAAKITLILQAGLLFYFFGKNGKVPYPARDIFFVLANAGCLFLACGIIRENFFLIKVGLFILIVQALTDLHFIISKYEQQKQLKKEQEETNEKK